MMMMMMIWMMMMMPILGKRKKSSSEWNAVNFDEIDREWEMGDEKQDLMTEDSLHFERVQKRREMLDNEDMSEVIRNPEKAIHRSAMAGPTMMFAKLDIENLKRADVEEISKIWQDKLFYGRIHVQNYVIEDDTILVTLQHGWEGHELRDFLLDQEHVKSITWDSKEYTRKPKKKRKKKRRRGKKREGL